MIEVKVLYADLSIQSALFENKEDLFTSDVLGLVVKTDKEKGKRQNITIGQGFDYYALCWGTQHGQLWVEIYSWDDGSFVRRRVTNPHDKDAKVEVLLPLACKHIIFHGIEVTDAKWKTALGIINKEIL